MQRTELYYDVARERLQSLDALNAEYVSRTAGILGIGLTMLTAAAIILRLSATPLGAGGLAPWAFFCLVVSFLLVAGCGVAILFPRNWERGPRLPALAGYVKGDEYSDQGLTNWVSDAYKDSVEINKTVLSHRAKALLLATICLAVEAVLLTAVVLLGYWPS